jgi:hypothetical protein
MPYIGNIVQDFSVNTAMLNTDSVTSIKIDDGTIVNADINDSAAIAMSKLALSITNSEVNASAAIAGTKISPSFTSNIDITNTLPKISLVDSDNNDDFDIKNQNGTFIIADATDSEDRLTIASNGQFNLYGNVDISNGIDVTGDITATGNLTISSANPQILLTDTGDNPDYVIKNNNGAIQINDNTNGITRLAINSDGHVDVAGNLDVGAGIDVTGAITATGNITATGGQLTLENGNEEQIHRFWSNISDSDIYGLLSGSTFGTIVEGANNGHHVIALRDNDTNDSVAIVSGGGDFKTGSPADTYDKLVARFRANGNTVIGGTLDVAGNITGTGDLTIDTNTLHVDSSNNRVGIGTTSPSVSLDIEATTPTIRLTDSDASGTPECEILGDGGDLILSADRDNEKASTKMLFKLDNSEVAGLQYNSSNFPVLNISDTTVPTNSTFRSNLFMDYSWFGTFRSGTNIQTVVSNNLYYNAPSGYHNFENANSTLMNLTGGQAIFFRADNAGSTNAAVTTEEMGRFDTTGLKLPAGKGINFSAYATSGNPSSNLLDDYEEGTFTPTFKADNSIVGSYTGSGYYTKIGNKVTCTFNFENKDGSGLPVGRPTHITDLPFTSDYSKKAYVSSGLMTNNITTRQDAVNYLGANNNYLRGFYMVSGSGWQHWTTSDFKTTGTYQFFQITYFTAS